MGADANVFAPRGPSRGLTPALRGQGSLLGLDANVFALRGPSRGLARAVVGFGWQQASLESLWLGLAGVRALACVVRVAGCPLRSTMTADAPKGRPYRHTMMAIDASLV